MVSIHIRSHARLSMHRLHYITCSIVCHALEHNSPATAKRKRSNEILLGIRKAFIVAWETPSQSNLAPGITPIPTTNASQCMSEDLCPAKSLLTLLLLSICCSLHWSSLGLDRFSTTDQTNKHSSALFLLGDGLFWQIRTFFKP
jgi:hypothetical protein